MISSARCIQARASIVSCPTVRMPVPTITSAPALLASSVMPHPTGGNTAAAPLIAAVDTRRTAAETPAGESARLWGLGTRADMGGLGTRSDVGGLGTRSDMGGLRTRSAMGEGGPRSCRGVPGGPRLLWGEHDRAVLPSIQ